MQLNGVMVRALKGAAASIILLFLAERRAMSQAEMRRYSGYADEAISDALGLLREMGMVTETGRYTWALLGCFQQLPIGTAEALPEQLGPDHPELPLNESMNQSDIEINQDDSFIDASSGNSGPADPVTQDDLETFGFYGQGLKALLAIRGLTFAEVAHQVKDAPSLGAALTRLKKRQPWARPVDQDVGEGSNPYICGEFAGFIQH